MTTRKKVEIFYAVIKLWALSEIFGRIQKLRLRRKLTQSKWRAAR